MRASRAFCSEIVLIRAVLAFVLFFCVIAQPKPFWMLYHLIRCFICPVWMTWWNFGRFSCVWTLFNSTKWISGLVVEKKNYIFVPLIYRFMSLNKIIHWSITILTALALALQYVLSNMPIN